MKTRTWFERVKELIYSSREKDHGDPDKSLSRIALNWRYYLRDKYPGTNVWIDAEDVCVMMIYLKLVRYSLGDKQNEDHFMDLMGYAGLVERLREKK